MAIECPTCGLLRFYGPTGLSAPQCMCLGGHQRTATPAPAPQWQPIETAPKDGKVLVWFSDLYGGMADVARLDDDKYAKKPRPYWSGNFERVLGILAYRNGKPTHWMPLPAAPEGQGKEAGNG